MDFSNMHFYKQMVGTFQHSISLPEGLTDSFTPLVGKVLNLKVLDGNTWHVGLIRSGSKLVLQPGWSDFVCSNNLSQTDLLVFKYMGETQFEVLMFDSSGCAKSGRENEDKQVKPENEEISNGSLCAVLNTERKFTSRFEPNQHVKKLHQSGVGEKGMLLDFCTSVKQEEGWNTAEEERSPSAKTSQNQRKRKAPSDSEVAPGDDAYCTPKRLVMTDNQKRRAQLLAREVTLGNPTFVQVLKSSHLTKSSFMVVPKAFLMAYLENENQHFILCLPNVGKTWLVRCYIHNGYSHFHFGKFVSDNELSGGDVCLFELVRTSNQVTFVVYISKGEHMIHTQEPIPDASYYMSLGLVLSNEQKKRARLLAREIKAGNPAFLSVLRSSNLPANIGINIPRDFFAEHLQNASQDALLCCHELDKTWLVRICCSRNRHSIKDAGWGKFVQENKLQEGHVCLFELIKTAQQLKFMVHMSTAL